MNCRRVESQLSAYLDGELTGSDMSAIGCHLRDCEECAQEAVAIKRIKEMVAQPCERAPAKDFEDRLVAHVFQAGRSERRHWASAFGFASIAVAAALLAVFAASKMGGARPDGLKSADAAYSSDLGHDQSYYSATDPLGGPAHVMNANYDQD